MKKDLKNNILASAGINGRFSGTTNIVGLAVDNKDFLSLTAVTCFGTIAATTRATVVLEESDDNTTFTDVTDANDLIRSGDSNPAITGASSDSCITVGYVGNKRYCRARIDVTANTGTANVSITMLQGKPLGAPVEGNEGL